MAVHLTLILLLSVGTSYILHIFYNLYKQRRWYKNLPGPPHSFFRGHLKAMGEVAATMPPNLHPQAYITAIARKYDLQGVFYLDLWPAADSMVIVTAPELMDYVHVKLPQAQHPFLNDFVAPIVGRDAIVAANGGTWKKLHNAMVPAFSPSHIRNLTSVVVDEMLLFRAKLETFSQSGDVFSMEEVAGKLMFDIAARITFNFSLNAQTHSSDYWDNLQEIVTLTETQFSWNPLRHIRTFFRRKVIEDRLYPSLVKKINERFALLKAEKVLPSRRDPLSILDLMLREDMVNEMDDIPKEYRRVLVSNLKALLLGASGATKVTICYMFMLLSKASEVLQKLRQEHDDVFHNASFDETLSRLQNNPQILAELKYTAAVIRETARLFPGGFGARVAKAGATVPYNDNTYPIDNNLLIIANSHTLHYDSKYFPDPDAFYPDRFLGPDSANAKNCFRTFSRGSRACLGGNMAMEEMKVLLLTTVRYYDFECAGLRPNSKPKAGFTKRDTVFGDIIFQCLGFDAKPRGGMMMRVRKRKD